MPQVYKLKDLIQLRGPRDTRPLLNQLRAQSSSMIGTNRLLGQSLGAVADMGDAYQEYLDQFPATLQKLFDLITEGQILEINQPVVGNSLHIVSGTVILDVNDTDYFKFTNSANGMLFQITFGTIEIQNSQIRFTGLPHTGTLDETQLTLVYSGITAARLYTDPVTGGTLALNNLAGTSSILLTPNGLGTFTLGLIIGSAGQTQIAGTVFSGVDIDISGVFKMAGTTVINATKDFLGRDVSGRNFSGTGTAIFTGNISTAGDLDASGVYRMDGITIVDAFRVWVGTSVQTAGLVQGSDMNVLSGGFYSVNGTQVINSSRAFIGSGGVNTSGSVTGSDLIVGSNHALLAGSAGKKIVAGNAQLSHSFAITAVNTGSKQFTIAGDQTAYFTAADTITVTGSTGNNGTYTVASFSFSAGNTLVVVNEAVPSAVADGNLNHFGLVVLASGLTSVDAVFAMSNSGASGPADTFWHETPSGGTVKIRSTLTSSNNFLSYVVIGSA